MIAGHVPVYFSNLSAVVPQVRDGLLRPLAVSDDKRHPQLPDVPTVIELGYPGFRTITWNGLVVPAATPKDIIGRLADEIAISRQGPGFHCAPGQLRRRSTLRPAGAIRRRPSRRIFRCGRRR